MFPCENRVVHGPHIEHSLMHLPFQQETYPSSKFDLEFMFQLSVYHRIAMKHAILTGLCSYKPMVKKGIEWIINLAHDDRLKWSLKFKKLIK